MIAALFQLHYGLVDHKQHDHKISVEEVGDGTFIITENRDQTTEKEQHQSLKYACKHCDQQFNMKRYLKYHIKSVHKKYACYWCGYKFSTLGNLSQHIHSEHKGAIYECKDFGRVVGNAEVSEELTPEHVS